MAEAGSGSDEWELCKENVQPLRHGRSFTEMSAAIQPSNAARIKQEQEYVYAVFRGSGKKRISGCCVMVRAGVNVRVRVRISNRVRGKG